MWHITPSAPFIPESKSFPSLQRQTVIQPEAKPQTHVPLTCFLL